VSKPLLINGLLCDFSFNKGCLKYNYLFVLSFRVHKVLSFLLSKNHLKKKVLMSFLRISFSASVKMIPLASMRLQHTLVDDGSSNGSSLDDLLALSDGFVVVGLEQSRWSWMILDF
jgi:hypothetical protein